MFILLPNLYAFVKSINTSEKNMWARIAIQQIYILKPSFLLQKMALLNFVPCRFYSSMYKSLLTTWSDILLGEKIATVKQVCLWSSKVHFLYWQWFNCRILLLVKSTCETP